MTSIILDCVKLNYVIGKYGQQTKHIHATTKTKEVREWVNQISQLDYAQAVYGAELLDTATLPAAKGPLDEFTMAEKVATKNFMEEAGYGTSAANQRLWRNLRKNLFQMREAGIDRILFYRTKEFDTHCKEYPKTNEITLLDTVLSWEDVYGPQIEQLEKRAIKWSEGDFTGKVYLDEPHVAQKLEVPGSSWNDAVNMWISRDEESASRLAEPKVGLPTQLWNPYDNHTISELSKNKSIFLSLLPTDNGHLSVCPIVPVREGDFLGVFAGMIRFSENFDPFCGIRGPGQRLWLDYSQVTGTLNQMRVSQPGGYANVRLQWELVNKEDETQLGVSWRVSVRADRAIMPFQEIIRAAPQKEHACADHQLNP
ncbi:hypothetical protein BDV26DRAFT_277124 [Aspergillus bertholletiae]|uniref:Uncharacterized protein n=1 Tax=Aspergillus bertholletiae TaxID=1226010 RepID=A0A5N7BQY4_9EURO|nr:hypothetical protein BDV26DRAFT_277124 [Aspergillus bertholletiae]